MEGAFEDREFYRIHLGGRPMSVHYRTSIRMFLYWSTRATHPGGTTVVALYSATIAGPRKTSPERSSERSYSGVRRLLPSKRVRPTFTIACRPLPLRMRCFGNRIG